MKQSNIGVLCVIAGSMMWGMMAVFTRPMYAAGVSAYTITETRYIISLALLVVILLVHDRSLFKIHKKDLWLFLGMGTFAMLVSNTLYCMGQQVLPMGIAGTLLYSYPCFVLIFSVIFLKEGMSVQKVIALVLSFFGCLMTSGILSGSEGIDIMGVIIVLLSAVAFSTYSIFGKFALKKYDTMTVLFYTYIFAGVPLLPFSDMGGFIEIVSDVPSVLIYTFLLGFVTTFMAYMTYNWGLKRLDAGKASILAYFEVFTSVVMGLLIYGEVPTAFNIIGITCILIALIFLNLNLHLDRFTAGRRPRRPKAADKRWR